MERKLKLYLKKRKKNSRNRIKIIIEENKRKKIFDENTAKKINIEEKVKFTEVTKGKYEKDGILQMKILQENYVLRKGKEKLQIKVSQLTGIDSKTFMN